MKYIVEVGEPVPNDLGEVAGKVAASFNISDAKAMALLRRAPGAMTKAVSEREADVVAGIFERAGLKVVKRPVPEEGETVGPEPARGAGGFASGAPSEGVPRSAPSPVEGAEEASSGARPAGEGLGGSVGGVDRGERAVGHPERSGDDDVWSQPLGASEHEPVDSFSRRDDFEERAADIGWEGRTWDAAAEEAGGDGAAAADVGRPGIGRDAGAPADAPSPAADEDEAIDVEMGTPPEERAAGFDAGGASAAMEGAAAAGAAAPEAVAPVPEGDGGPQAAARGRRRGRRGQPAPARERPGRPARGREAAGRSAERGADESQLRRGGMRRGIGWVGVLPPLLSLLAMGAAMLILLVPIARDQQGAQAADAAAAQAASLEALTGGLPLSAQTLSSALVDLSNNAQALLRPHGVSLMVVTDANGAPLAGWYGPAKTPAAMPPATRQAVSARALTAVAGGPAASAPDFTQKLRDTWRSVKAMVGQGAEPELLRAAPVVSAGQAIGAVVVGVPPISGQQTLVSAFETVLLVGLVPLLIGILMALGLTGGLRRKVQYLLDAADRISRGDLDEPVSLKSRDELGQLGRAIERMRVSLSTLLEHRRRHR